MAEDHTPSTTQDPLDQETEQAENSEPKRSSKFKWLLLFLLVFALCVAGFLYFPTLKQSLKQKITAASITKQQTEFTNQIDQPIQPQALPPATKNDQQVPEQREMLPAQYTTPQLDFSSLPNFRPLLLALHHLETQAHTSKPFSNELNGVLAQIPTLPKTLGPAFSQLATLADAGVPTTEQLSQEFDKLITSPKPTASNQAPASNWVDKSKNWIKGLVSVRYTSPKQQTSVQMQQDPLLIRVQALLLQGNLPAILEHRTALERLENRNMTEWLDQVYNRAFLQQMLPELKTVGLLLFMFSTLAQSRQERAQQEKTQQGEVDE